MRALHTVSTLFLIVVVAVATSTSIQGQLMQLAGTAKDAKSGKNPECFDYRQALFVKNVGQWADEAVRFALRGSGANILVTGDGVAIHLRGEESGFGGWGSGVSGATVTMRFVGANKVTPEGIEPSETVMNYFCGSQQRWKSNVPTYGGVTYRGLYDGIDLFVRGRQDGLKLEFHVAPGADWRKIAVAYGGINSLRLDSAGRLTIAMPAGDIIDQAPQIYQEISGERITVCGRLCLLDKETCAFEVTGLCNSSCPLVIDPELVWSTYLGGDYFDKCFDMAVDAYGNVYVTGETGSSDFPTTHALDATLNAADAFVAKFSADGQQLLWSTYLGGNSGDFGHGIAVDMSGDVCVTGATGSPDFPTPNGWDTTHDGDWDVFVCKFSPAGQLLWSTYLGGGSPDTGFDVAVDSAGNIYVTGWTESGNLGTWNSWDPSYNGDIDCFVSKFACDGQQLLWSTYLGGSYPDYGRGIALDKWGNVFVVGNTDSPDLPTPHGWDTSHTGVGYYMAFVAKIAPNGKEVLWSTFLGGRSGESGNAIAVDIQGNAYVAGRTSSDDFPTTNAWDATLDGLSDGFASKFSADGQRLLWSTYLGGRRDDSAKAIAVDGAGNIYVTGEIQSIDLLRMGGLDFESSDTAHQSLSEYTPNAVYFPQISFPGGIYYDWGSAIAIDASRSVYLAGTTDSPSFPTLNGWDMIYNGGSSDGFVSKFSGAPWRVAIGFTEGCSDWTTGTAPLVFAPPEFACDVGYLRMFSQASANTFGCWHSPSDAIRVEAGFLYRARFNVVTDITNSSLVPQIRLRVSWPSFQQSDYLNIESAGDGGSSPIPQGRNYDLYFVPRASDSAAPLAFDLLAFDPLDAPHAQVALHSVVVDRFDLGLFASSTTVRDYTFGMTTEQWTASPPTVVFDTPIHIYAVDSLQIKATNNTNTFGWWQSATADIVVEANRLYRGAFEVRTDVTDRSRVPQMRMRFNTANLQASRTLGIESIGDGANSPRTTTTIYDNLYFLPPANCVGEGLIVSFDMLNFSPDDASTGSLILDRATIETLLLPGSP